MCAKGLVTGWEEIGTKRAKSWAEERALSNRQGGGFFDSGSERGEERSGGVWWCSGSAEALWQRRDGGGKGGGDFSLRSWERGSRGEGLGKV